MKPQMINYPNFDELKKLCEEYINVVDEDGYEDDDLTSFIFEKAIEAFYGKDIWEWVDEKLMD